MPYEIDNTCMCCGKQIDEDFDICDDCWEEQELMDEEDEALGD